MAKRIGIVGVSRIMEVLRLDESTGKLYWNYRPDARKCWNTRYSGNEAFTTTDSRGYRIGSIDGVILWAHHVVHAIYTGEITNLQIDHINRDAGDNRPINLRVATSSDNLCNRRSLENTKSKFRGVTRKSDGKKWQVMIKKNGSAKWVGVFSDEIEAAHAYDAAAILEHGEFASLNFKS